uniref:Uncharacterized protein n=1 Tax=Ciona intestinalis TaxID=7719 RepID=H2XU52_CIOIN
MLECVSQLNARTRQLSFIHFRASLIFYYHAQHNGKKTDRNRMQYEFRMLRDFYTFNQVDITTILNQNMSHELKCTSEVI